MYMNQQLSLHGASPKLRKLMELRASLQAARPSAPGIMIVRDRADRRGTQLADWSQIIGQIVASGSSIYASKASKDASKIAAGAQASADANALKLLERKAQLDREAFERGPNPKLLLGAAAAVVPVLGFVLWKMRKRRRS